MPEAATLVTLADLLGCTLDQLMRETLTDDPAVPAPIAGGFSEDDLALYAAYDRHMNRFARMMAAGVALVLLGVATLMVCYNLVGESGVVVLPLFLCLAAAVFLFVSGGIAHGDFQRSYPEIPDCCDPGEREQFRHFFRVGIAGAVAGILADVALLVVLTSLNSADRAVLWSTTLFFILLALCVGILVLLGVLHSKYDLGEYALAASGKRTDYGGAIMLAATAVFLLTGFLFQLWHIGWVVFPIGGILCGIVSALQKKK